jgi:hypothetical protein
VLLAGGVGVTGNALASAELYATSVCRTCTLTVAFEGTGSGTVSTAGGDLSCPDACTAYYEPGTSVTLTAAAAAGSSFTGWGGGCTGAPGDTCTLTLEGPQTVTATFTKVTHLLTVVIGGSSVGSVSSSPAGIAGCTGTCVASFAYGTAVTLTAAPAAGATVKEWRGACTGSSASCTFTLTAAAGVTAVFSRAFTDATLVARTTLVKALHVSELREAVNTLRSRFSLGAASWTDPILTVRSTRVKAVHLSELRTALNAAYTKAGCTPPTYTDPTLTARVTLIKATHVNELRTAVRGLE